MGDNKSLFLIQECSTSKVWAVYNGYEYELATINDLPALLVGQVVSDSKATLKLCQLRSGNDVVVVSIDSMKEYTKDTDNKTKGNLSIVSNAKRYQFDLWYAMRIYTILLKLNVWENNLINASETEEGEPISEEDRKSYEGAAKFLRQIKGVIGATVNNPLDLAWR